MKFDYTSFTHLTAELRANGVLLVTLNRPEVLNAWNEALTHDIIDVMRTADRDTDVRVVVVTGAGKAFSVGGDHDHLENIMADIGGCAVSSVKLFGDFIRSLVDLDKIVIAAINGDVMGGGLSLALTSDISLMSDRARMLCGAQLNMSVTPAEAPYLWPLLCGLTKAKYLMLTSQVINAAEAERVGLISAVLPHDQVFDHALAMADKLAERDQLAMGWTKRAMNHYLRQNASALDFALASEALTFLRPEAARGLAEIRERIGSKRTL